MSWRKTEKGFVRNVKQVFPVSNSLRGGGGLGMSLKGQPLLRQMCGIGRCRRLAHAFDTGRD